MGQSQPTLRHRAQIASLTPGRLRFKLHPQSRGALTMKGIQTDLQSREGVQDVKVNPASGSVTLQFDPRCHSPAGIIGLLEDVDVLVESIGHLPTVDDGKPGEGLESISFLAAVEDLNQRIRSATGLPINLKIILPLSFIGAGIWSIARKGLMIEAIPGGVFLWLAFDMFVKLHPIPNNKTSTTSTAAREWD
jgi:hypothetical protein